MSFGVQVVLRQLRNNYIVDGRPLADEPSLRIASDLISQVVKMVSITEQMQCDQKEQLQCDRLCCALTGVIPQEPVEYYSPGFEGIFEKKALEAFLSSGETRHLLCKR